MKNTLFVVITIFIFGSCKNLPNNNLIDITELGAKPNDTIFDSDAIQQAIDKISELGGGTVYVPPGNYFIKPLTLKSNITLYLEKGSVLIASKNFDDFPYVQTRWEGTVCKGFQPILYAYKQENITIEGGGKIDGNGKVWWDEYRRLNDSFGWDHSKYKPANKWAVELAQINKDCPPLSKRPQWDLHWLRPMTIQFYECENIKVEGITIVNSPFWTIHPVFSKNLQFRDLTINNPLKAWNTDGIDPESCDGVIITNCNFTNGDDCISIKSGIDEDGRNYNVPSKNIVISNCVFSSKHQAIAIGSEMSGGVENVLVSDCVIPFAGNAIQIKSKRLRGGYVKNVRFTDIVIGKAKRAALSVNMYYRGGEDVEKPEVNDGTPFIYDITFSGIQCDTCNIPIDVAGIEESPIHNVRFNDINIHNAESLSIIKFARALRFTEVYINREKFE